jgi:hypothetical protein
MQQHDNAAACLYYLIRLAFLRPSADWTDCLPPWVVIRGRSYGFLKVDSEIDCLRKGDPTPFLISVSDRRMLNALVEVRWARKVLIADSLNMLAKIAGEPHLKHEIEGCAVCTQETTLREV